MITILVVSWGMLRFVEHRPFVSLGFELRNALQDSVLGIVIGTGMLLLSMVVLWLGGWAKLHHSGVISGLALAAAGLAMLMNTVTQEILVRDYILQSIQARSGAIPAVILSSIIFALLHLPAARSAPLAMLNLFAIGLLYGYARVVTGNLWSPMGMHFAWNFVLGPVLGLVVSGKALGGNWCLLALQARISHWRRFRTGRRVSLLQQLRESAC